MFQIFQLVIATCLVCVKIQMDISVDSIFECVVCYLHIQMISCQVITQTVNKTETGFL